MNATLQQVTTALEGHRDMLKSLVPNSPYSAMAAEYAKQQAEIKKQQDLLAEISALEKQLRGFTD